MHASLMETCMQALITAPCRGRLGGGCGTRRGSGDGTPSVTKDPLGYEEKLRRTPSVRGSNRVDAIIHYFSVRTRSVHRVAVWQAK